MQHGVRVEITDKTEIQNGDRLSEIRQGLAQVRFDKNPPWGLKSLFTAVFRLIDVVEEVRVDLAETRNRLAKHELRLKGIEPFEVSRAKQTPLIELDDLAADDANGYATDEGVLDVFR